MTKYMRQGSAIIPSNHAVIHDSLPLGTYQVQLSDTGYFLETIPDFTEPEKVYGDVLDRIDRTLQTYESRSSSTGILLEGEKGSGKTLFARVLSARLRERGVSTIVVNSPHVGDGFKAFLSSIDVPFMLFFDEFEKVYHDKNHQSQMLTVFDGVFQTKRLNVVTVNEVWGLSDYMINRPGRFFYSYQYGGLDERSIREYCGDKLVDASRVDSIVAWSKSFEKLNFDMLQALVEEMNRYDEGVADASRFLNVKSAAFGGMTYTVTDVEIKNESDLPPGYWVDVIGSVVYGHSVATDNLEIYGSVYVDPAEAGSVEDEGESNTENGLGFVLARKPQRKRKKRQALDLYGGRKEMKDLGRITIYMEPAEVVAASGDTVVYENDELKVTLRRKHFKSFGPY